MIKDDAHSQIVTRLGDLETERGFQILYACESGSRAWGFASQDSDYDVRLLYVWPKDHYLSVDHPADDLDLPIDADLIDLSGWDLRKALRLFRSSNGALLEWLHSPVVYRENEKMMKAWRAFVPQVFDPVASANHYLGMFKNSWLGGIETGKVTAKVYLYALRALLAARHVREQQTPIPVLFAELLSSAELPEEVDSAIRTMIAKKEGRTEAAPISREPIIDHWVEGAFAQAKADAADCTPAKISPEVAARLDAFFRDTLANPS